MRLIFFDGTDEPAADRENEVQEYFKIIFTRYSRGEI